ncbi:hypothetical protein KUTeg_010463 [Tegillarca granosa]|uniref:Uncharacterized protein n=1 Tax=Tegillarca granosa TaxID=220873 RepID=A0ABQ9F9Z4_TEGGR|nr:hypothetical protein KUTeg_010463 [Tegillarca granosa]
MKGAVLPRLLKHYREDLKSLTALFTQSGDDRRVDQLLENVSLTSNQINALIICKLCQKQCSEWMIGKDNLKGQRLNEALL